ncbi:related to Tripeptidyl-peptidase sed4 [Cephalotrichum gorgonifer]|uniref:tripeptidyl-peptidase II n=1 Tax=Cephalotrichum gorgonifer TaxID=2041049 RepID=A0AAE8MWT0_9PEZI|nr:related to Tripeptidyl-peptidase sed4 [Cephalotrichum gorgonifer]
MAPRGLLQHGFILAQVAGIACAALVSRADYLPSSVQMLAVAPEDTPITLEIGLKMQKVDKLESLLRDVSDPRSPNYGKYLTADEVNEMFRPTEESSTAVKSWLLGQGIKDIEDRGFYINFATTVEGANRLLNASFSYYDIQGTKKLRTREYSIAHDVSRHIELVTPTTYFGTTKPFLPVYLPVSEEGDELASLAARPDKEPVCSRLLTPPCLKKMYGFGDYEPDPQSGSRVAFASFINQSAVPDDLNTYTEMFGLPKTSWKSVIINNGNDHQDWRAGVEEGNLDSQMMALSAKTLPMTHYITGGSPPFVPNLRITADKNTNEPYLEFYQYLMTLKNEEIAQVISISYGDDEQTVPRDYATRTCNLMGMMGLRGVSIIESSGDAGVGAPCRANDGSDRVEFTPQFPASCPYITSIGGTQGYEPEIAWVGSGSGFSNYFKRAWYQKDAVRRYLDHAMDRDLKEEYKQYADYKGRGFPDISGHSAAPFYQVIIGGSTQFSGGTSAAAPLIAGMIGLLNDARLRAGKPVMGFLNPWLYGEARGVLTDVTGGYAKGCDGFDTQTGMAVPGAGVVGERGAFWNATAGWDPATGLGLPNFERMLKVALDGRSHGSEPRRETDK